jgi:hypothetical protein
VLSRAGGGVVTDGSSSSERATRGGVEPERSDASVLLTGPGCSYLRADATDASGGLPSSPSLRYSEREPTLLVMSPGLVQGHFADAANGRPGAG